MGKNKSASTRQIAEIVRMLAEGEYDGSFAQALVERRVQSFGSDLVTVPDLTTLELMESLERQLEVECQRSHREWFDFENDKRGMTFEVVTWTPEDRVTSAEVCSHFIALGCANGNIPAFLAWLLKNNPLHGRWTSLPCEEVLFGEDCMPIYLAEYPSMIVPLFNTGWEDYSFVAFREVKAA